MMKKIIFIILAIAFSFFILFQAAQQVVGVMSGLSGLIDSRLVTGQGYTNFLRGTLKNIDSYDLKAVKQHIKEDTEFKLRYVDQMQKILKKLAEVKQVDDL